MRRRSHRLFTFNRARVACRSALTAIRLYARIVHLAFAPYMFLYAASSLRTLRHIQLEDVWFAMKAGSPKSICANIVTLHLDGSSFCGRTTQLPTGRARAAREGCVQQGSVSHGGRRARAARRGAGNRKGPGRGVRGQTGCVGTRGAHSWPRRGRCWAAAACPTSPSR